MTPVRFGAALGAVLAAAAAVLVAAFPAAGQPLAAQHVTAVCPTAAPGHARCLAELRTDISGGRGVRGATALPAGYGPADLDAAYHLPATGGANQTVAIVDAGDDASAAADLAVYRQTYGLPACTTANGCFRQVNQAGASSPLPASQGWEVEIALDLDMVSASCPQCHILLVAGNTASYGDLAAAEDTAVRLGATEVSNSYGGAESALSVSYAPDYNHPGVAIVASSGDSGYGIPEAPAVFSNVISVGGTSLVRATNARGWTETVWNSDGGAPGSGCSAWIDKPSWQHDPNCGGRMVADVAADADPNTGPAVYDTANGAQGWLVVGGTSAAAPYLSGVIALAGNPSARSTAASFYAATSGLNKVVSGNNVVSWGLNCGGDYQCTAGPGYNGPTGNGTPNGLSAF